MDFFEVLLSEFSPLEAVGIFAIVMVIFFILSALDRK